MTPSLNRAAGAYLSAVLKGGKALAAARQRECTSLSSIGIKRKTYKHASLTRLLVAAAYSDGVVSLFSTNGHTAFGPLDVDDALCHEVEANGGSFADCPDMLPCLTDVCPALASVLNGVDLERHWGQLTITGRYSDEEAAESRQPHITLRNDNGDTVAINPVYLQAAVRHLRGRHSYSIDHVTIYQRADDSLGPILFVGDSGRLAVAMPIRLD